MKENKKIEKIRDKGRLIFFAILFIGANISFFLNSLNLSFSHSLTILIQVLILIIALIILAKNEKKINSIKRSENNI